MMHLAQPAAQQGSWMSSVLVLVLMLALFYFLIIRPQQKRQKQHQAMIAALKKGDRVVTFSGLYGTIVDLTEDKVVLRVNESTRLTFERGAIKAVLNEEK